MEKQHAEIQGSFRSPHNSLPVSASSSQSIGSAGKSRSQRFQSHLLDGEYERPWINDSKLRRSRLGNYIIWGFVCLSLLLSAYYNYAETKKVPKYQYCLLLDDQFSAVDTSVWNYEVQINGFGTGEFDWTTTANSNVFVDAEGLHIIPTLTNETTSITSAEIFNGYTLNLSKAGGDGTCTGTTSAECSIRSNQTQNIVIPPVRSARLNTKGKKSIRYGRVEVVARLPRGDWLWPAIWMMPVTDTYGPWPASGEIDIMESRGNGISYPNGGRNVMSSTLHWGPTSIFDAFWRTTGGRPMQRGDYSDAFHTFGLVWSKNQIYTYVDNPLSQVMVVEFPQSSTMWQRGHFSGDTVNSTLLFNPWAQSMSPNAPFDRPFYLIINVAVGGTNGYFEDAVGDKPWSDAGPAASEFYKSVDTWLPTWPSGSKIAQRGMTIKSVKMWQQGPCS